MQATIGEFELDESYFGAHRVRGIRGRGARGKIIVFGIFKRPNTVYTYIVNDCSTETLMPIIKEIISNIIFLPLFHKFVGVIYQLAADSICIGTVFTDSR